MNSRPWQMFNYLEASCRQKKLRFTLARPAFRMTWRHRRLPPAGGEPAKKIDRLHPFFRLPGRSKAI